MALPEGTLSARLRVQQFVHSFEPGYRDFACHAALPLTLTPELLNYLRNRFLLGQVPWVAEADLLLSDLCSEIGYETYAMDSDVRAYLIGELGRDFGTQRMAEVARLLIHYVRHLARNNPKARQHDLQTQQWSALVYLDDRRVQAVREIGEALRACAAELSGDKRGPAHAHRNEMLRLTNLIDELAHQLADYPELVSYARLTREVLADTTAAVPEHVRRSRQFEEETALPGGMLLPAVNALLPKAQARSAVRRIALIFTTEIGSASESVSTSDAEQFADAIASLGYQVNRLVYRSSTQMNELERLAASLTANHLMLFYFNANVWTAQNARGGPRLMLGDPAAVRAGIMEPDVVVSDLITWLSLKFPNLVVIFNPLYSTETTRWRQELTTDVSTPPGNALALIGPPDPGYVTEERQTLSADFSETFSRRVTRVFLESVTKPGDKPLTPILLFGRIEQEYPEEGAGPASPFFVSQGRGSELSLTERQAQPAIAYAQTTAAVNPFDATDYDENAGNIEGALLTRLFDGVRRRENLWLVGAKGTGKTSLLRTFCDVAHATLEWPRSAFIYANAKEDDFDAKLDRALIAARPLPFVVCFDNVDRSDRIAGGIAFALATGPASIVLASRLPPTRDVGLQTYRTIYLPELVPEAARAFVVERLQDTDVTFTDEEITALVNQSEGNLRSLRLAASRLYTERRETVRPYDASVVESPVPISENVEAPPGLPPRGYVSYNRSQLPRWFPAYRVDGFATRVAGELRNLVGESSLVHVDTSARLSDSGLENSSFFIPIINRYYFKSRSCRVEVQQFLKREETLQRKDLIFPIHLGGAFIDRADPLSQEIGNRQRIPLTPYTANEGLPQFVQRVASLVASALRREVATIASKGEPLDTSIRARVQALRSIPAFAVLSEDEALSVAAGMSALSFVPGAIIVPPGPVKALNFIASGRVWLSKRGVPKVAPPLFALEPSRFIQGAPAPWTWLASPDGAAGYKLEASALTAVFQRSADLPERIAEKLFADGDFKRLPGPEALAARIRRAFKLPPAMYRDRPVTPFASSGRTLVVDQKRGGDFRTISAAIHSARDGDRILIRPGTYRESLTLTTSLELAGDTQTSGQVILETRGSIGISSTARSGSIANITLVPAIAGALGVRVDKGDLKIDRCIIERFNEIGVQVSPGAAARIHGSIISSCSIGVLFKGHGEVMRSSIVDNRRVGVFIERRGRARIERNDISNNGEFGISIAGGSAFIDKNAITGNGSGPLDPARPDSRTVQVFDNDISSSPSQPATTRSTSSQQRASPTARKAQTKKGRQTTKKTATRPQRAASAVARAGGRKSTTKGGSKATKKTSTTEPRRSAGSGSASVIVQKSSAKPSSKTSAKRSNAAPARSGVSSAARTSVKRSTAKASSNGPSKRATSTTRTVKKSAQKRAVKKR